MLHPHFDITTMSTSQYHYPGMIIIYQRALFTCPKHVCVLGISERASRSQMSFASLHERSVSLFDYHEVRK
jgi:hypothetical protein